MLRTVTLGALLAFAGGDALAQPMYRCGSSYSAVPCQGATVVQAAHQPSAADARHATMAAQQDARRADTLEKARLAQEARAPKAIIIGGNDKPAQGKAAEAPSAKPQKGKKPEHFTATSPRPPGDSGKKKKS
jgi:sRNA-binding protein